MENQYVGKEDGGQGGIRTHGTFSSLHVMKNANHWNGAIYTDEFAGINTNLTVF